MPPDSDMGVIVPTETAEAEDGRLARREAERRVGVSDGDGLPDPGALEA